MLSNVHSYNYHIEWNRCAAISSLEIMVNDFVTVNDENPRTDDRIGRIAYMWEENNKQKFHINWMM